jgi:cold shock CspA family protein
MEPNESVHDRVAEHVQKLEDLFGGITSCHVGLRAPSEHHRTGGPYEVSIKVALPGGREVEVRRTPKLDERHADLSFALDDAFRRARRQLQDQVRRMQDRVKTHEPQSAGTVTRFDHNTGYGFIQAGDGHEVYFHKNSLLGAPISDIAPGIHVTFAEEIGEKGPQASTVHILRKHKMR